MKKEISTILIVGVFSAVFSLIISNMFISTSNDRKQSVEVVEPISTTFEKPSQTYFNSQSVNPAQNIQIGTDPNSNPFEDR
jgi:hypothetical protein